MRIAHFLLGRCNPDSANGVEKTVYYLSKSQALLGNMVSLFSLTAKPPIPIPGVTVRAYTPKQIPFCLPQSLLVDLIEWQPDIVHLHSVYSPWNVALTHWLRSQDVPYVTTPHGGLSPHVLTRRWYLKVPYRWLFELPTHNRAAFVHSVCDADDIESYGVRAPIVIAPNGLDTSSIPSGLDTELLASRFPQVHGKRIFIFLGRLDPLHKGLDVLMESLSKVQTRSIVLVLIGPDWQKRKRVLEILANKLGITSQVVFTGPAYGKEKFDLLAGADVFVHTSRWEGLPFAVLEAAALGIPCLVTPAADPCGMLSRYQAGVLVQPNPRSIAGGLRQLAMMPPAELQVMGARAREMVREEFPWEKTATTIVAAYRTYATKPNR